LSSPTLRRPTTPHASSIIISAPPSQRLTRRFKLRHRHVFSYPDAWLCKAGGTRDEFPSDPVRRRGFPSVLLRRGKFRRRARRLLTGLKLLEQIHCAAIVGRHPGCVLRPQQPASSAPTRCRTALPLRAANDRLKKWAAATPGYHRGARRIMRNSGSILLRHQSSLHTTTLRRGSTRACFKVWPPSHPALASVWLSWESGTLP